MSMTFSIHGRLARRAALRLLVTIFATLSIGCGEGAFRLTVNIEGDGEGTVQTSSRDIDCSRSGNRTSGACTGEYADASIVTLSAINTPGSTFGGWSGACATGTPICAVTMTQARSVTATFRLSRPAVRLVPDSLDFTVDAGGGAAMPQDVAVSSVAGGVLTGLSIGAVVYSSGQPSGWLAPTLTASTTPTTLRIGVVPGTIAPGTYRAIVPVVSSLPGVTPDTLVARLIVRAPSAPQIALSRSSVVLAAIVGGTAPGPETVGIANAGTGTLTGLSIGSISYGTAGTQWLGTPTLSAATAPASLTLQATTSGLSSADTLTAVVPVRSSAPGVTNSPQNVAVTLHLAAPLQVVSTSLPTATLGQAYSQTLQATAGWSGCTWTLASGTLPAGFSLTPAGVISGSGTVAGTSAFTVVASCAQPLTSQATRQLSITVAAAPRVVLGASRANLRSVSGSPPQAGSIDVAVFNGGGGQLGTLTPGAPTYLTSLDNGATRCNATTNWLTATIVQVTGRPFLRLVASPGQLGRNCARLAVSASAAGAVPDTIEITVTTSPAGVLALSADTVWFHGPPSVLSTATARIEVRSSGSTQLSGQAVAVDVGGFGPSPQDDANATLLATPSAVATPGSVLIEARFRYPVGTTKPGRVTVGTRQVVVLANQNPCGTPRFSDLPIFYGDGTSAGTATSVVQNSGTQPLTIIRAVTSSPWLSVSGLVGGTLGQAGQRPFTLRFDSSGLPFGTYTDTVLVETRENVTFGDDCEGRVSVENRRLPVRMVVGPPVALVARPSAAVALVASRSGSPLVQELDIEVENGETFTGLALGPIDYQGGPSGWLAGSQLVGTATPTRLRLNVSAAGLAAGSVQVARLLVRSAQEEAPLVVSVELLVAE